MKTVRVIVYAVAAMIVDLLICVVDFVTNLATSPVRAWRAARKVEEECSGQTSLQRFYSKIKEE